VAEGRFIRNAGAVFSPRYRLVPCAKYRRPVLVGAVAERPRELRAGTAGGLAATLQAVELLPDPVRLFVGSDPSWAVGRCCYAGSVGHVSGRAVGRCVAGRRGR
jgi:putative transposase